MSLKENVEYIKNEISTEEKFFEGFFKLEKFWKKYKIIIIATVTAAFVGFVGLNINEYLQTQKAIKANTAFNILLENPNNKEAKVLLKAVNPKLLLIAQHINNNAQNKNNSTDIEFINQIVKFNIAIDKNDLEAINKVVLNPKFLLKEYALFQKALIQTLNKNYADAKETIKLIPENSSVSQLVNKLKHHLLTK